MRSFVPASAARYEGIVDTFVQLFPPRSAGLIAHVQGVETSLALGWLGILPPGVVIPFHSHAEPEVFYVLEGSLEVYRESGEAPGWSTTPPGGGLAIPGNVKHALRNASSTPTTVVVRKNSIQRF